MLQGRITMTNYTDDADKVIAAEKQHISEGKETDTKRIGLAFSGGGIRSASFGMGLMQSLVADGKLAKMDYLSTVSGGGFLGSSLTWFLSQKSSDGKAYGTSAENFPFGSKREGGKENTKNSILDFIRQHGNYLTPNHKINPSSLIATALKTMLVSFSVYFGLIVSLMATIIFAYNSIAPTEKIAGYLVYAYAVGGLSVVWITLSAFYSLFTFFKGAKYSVSVFIQQSLGLLITLMLILVILGLLPFLHTNLDEIIKQYSIGINTNAVLGGTSMTSVITAAAISLKLYLQSMHNNKNGSSSLKIFIAAALLLFGTLFGAYIVALHIVADTHALILLASLIFVTLIFGLLCNVNYFGLNRMYRNRLMEAFMPDRSSITSGKWGLANDANGAKVADMCQSPNNRPYHLINCNIVLVDSNTAKYRGRKGDSFLISPLYCGSDATGWLSTKNYMVNNFRSGLSLPTSMAISGAAANPNSGVSGKGVTTNKIVSGLMSLLNLRLGFWASNPKSKVNNFPPNYFYPGLKGGFPFSSGLNENDRAIELTDGGHFENLGIYELLRRRLDLIVVSDAGADPLYTFSDIANAVERSRVDFGVNIVFSEEYPLEDIISNCNTQESEVEKNNDYLAKRCFAIATIQYSKETAKEKRQEGTLIYIKPTIIKGLSADILGYKRQNPLYPNEPTSDQFFSEQQFEAYRELGYYLGWQMLEENKERGWL